MRPNTSQCSGAATAAGVAAAKAFRVADEMTVDRFGSCSLRDNATSPSQRAAARVATPGGDPIRGVPADDESGTGASVESPAERTTSGVRHERMTTSFRESRQLYIL
jgi:hypothetical protein